MQTILYAWISDYWIHLAGFLCYFVQLKKVSWNPEIQLSWQHTTTDIGCRTWSCLRLCTSNTEVSCPGAGRSSILSRFSHISSPKLSPTCYSPNSQPSPHQLCLPISSQCQPKTKHSLKCIRWERKEQKRQEFPLCNKVPKPSAFPKRYGPLFFLPWHIKS